MSLWFNFYVVMVQLLCRYGSTFMSLWFNFYVVMVQLLCRYGSTFMSLWFNRKFKEDVFVNILMPFFGLCRYGLTFAKKNSRISITYILSEAYIRILDILEY
jgi:hypothetical protein